MIQCVPWNWGVRFQVALTGWQRERREVSVGRQAPMCIRMWSLKAGGDQSVGTCSWESTDICPTSVLRIIILEQTARDESLQGRCWKVLWSGEREGRGPGKFEHF